MERSLERHSMSIPATWITCRQGRRPAPVATAPPSGIGPFRPSSQKIPYPPFLLIAPDTPCGQSSHHGMMFRFQALTTASTRWSQMSPETRKRFGPIRARLSVVAPFAFMMR